MKQTIVVRSNPVHHICLYKYEHMMNEIVAPFFLYSVTSISLETLQQRRNSGRFTHDQAVSVINGRCKICNI